MSDLEPGDRVELAFGKHGKIVRLDRRHGIDMALVNREGERTRPSWIPVSQLKQVTP